MGIHNLSLMGTLSIAQLALNAQQIGLRVTGQNIANINTPGYSLQTTVLSPLGNFLGVNATNILRSSDSILSGRIYEETSSEFFLDMKSTMLSQIEAFINESEAEGINGALNEFFNSLQDLSLSADGTAERQGVLGKANILVNELNRTAQAIKDIQYSSNNKIKEMVTEVNSIAQEIARLNVEAAAANAMNPGGGNTLLDQRDELVRQLSELMDVKVMYDSQGNVSIMTQRSGYTLVSNDTASELTLQTNGNNHNYYDVCIDMGNGAVYNIMNDINGGELGGLIAVRDVSSENVLDNLDRMTATLINEFNKIHRRGYGLDGSTDLNFFEPLTARGTYDTNNDGDASISATILDYDSITYDNYVIEFEDVPPMTYNIYREGDLTTPIASGVYSSGSPILIEGLSVTISDGAGGGPAAGDKFYVSTRDNAALNVSLNSEIEDDLNKIAASSSPDELPGNNEIALELANLIDAKLFQNGNSNIINYYGAIVSQVGSEIYNTDLTLESQHSVVEQLTTLKEEISGVSLDEESINLMAYQRAYEASSKVISVVDEMLAELLNII